MTTQLTGDLPSLRDLRTRSRPPPLQIRLLHLEELRGELSSKQQALEKGVAHASFPLIALTDADMILDPAWLANLEYGLRASQADLLFGHTILLKRSEKLLELLEEFQLEFLFCFAHALSALRIPGSCMGNNVIIKKKSYLEAGGQSAVGYSIVEDRDLLDLFRRKGFTTLAQEPFLPRARTYTASTPRQFYHQMRRWAAGGLRPQSNLFGGGILLGGQILSFGAAALGLLSLLPAMICIGNFFLTWIFTAVAFRKIHSPLSSRLFPLFYIFLTFEALLFGVSLILNPRITWKNRTLKKQ